MAETLNGSDRQLLDMLDHPPTIQAETASGPVTLAAPAYPVTPVPVIEPQPDPNKKPHNRLREELIRRARERGLALCGDFGGETFFAGRGRDRDMRERGICTNDAGMGTDHPGTGRCMHHEPAMLEAIEEKKRRFLAVYAEQPMTQAKAAQIVGTSVTAVQQWRKFDDGFDAAVAELVEQAEASRLALVEDAVFARCINTSAPADALRMFYLTNRAPDRWQDRRALSVTGKDGGPLEVEHSVRQAVRVGDQDIII